MVPLSVFFRPLEYSFGGLCHLGAKNVYLGDFLFLPVEF